MIVIEGGISSEYFFDKMQMYELQPFINNMNKKNKESWEQTRLLAYILAQVNSTKKLSMTDIIKFSWDLDENKVTSISNEDIERLKNKAKEFENKI